MINRDELIDYINDNCTLGLYEDEKFYIIPSWEVIRECNRIQGIEFEWDYPKGDNVLEFGQILGYMESEFPFPIDQDYIDLIISSLYTQDLIANGQTSYIDIGWNLDISQDIARRISEWYQINLNKFPTLDPVSLTNLDIKDHIDSIKWGFDDEYHVCDNCYSVIFRIQPDSYSWTPEHYDSEYGDWLCRECAQDYIDECIDGIQSSIDNGNQPKSLPWIFDLTNEWQAIPHPKGYSWENGLHPGQNDSPLKQGQIVRSIKSNGESLFEIIFRIHPSQFYISWDVYIRVNPNLDITLSQNEIDSFISEFANEFDSPNGRTKFDNATLAQKALQNLSTRFNSISWDSETGEITVKGTNNLEDYLNQ